MDQDLIDFCNDRIAFYQSEITTYENQKLGADDAIAQMEANIVSLNNSKDQADQSIENFNKYIGYVQRILNLLNEQNS